MKRGLFWLFRHFCLVLLVCLVLSAGSIEKSFPADETGYAGSLQSGRKTARSTIDSSCTQRLGILTIPPDMVALNFKIRQIYQGVNCTTAMPIADKTFSIKNRANDEMLYRFRQSGDDTPMEGLGKLDRLVLPPGEYALSVGGGAGAVCTVEYELSTETSWTPHSGNMVRSTIDNQCVQRCGEMIIPYHSAALNFRLNRLDAGYNCATGNREERQVFSIENIETGNRVFISVKESGQRSDEKPVRLSALVLHSGRYRLCVAGGKGANCSLSYDLVSPPPGPPLPEGPSSLRSHITNECVQNCVELNVGDYSVARGFHLKKLESGYNCQTGDKIDALGFSILNTDTDQFVYRYIRHPGQEPIERYGALDGLVLKPGHYRMCVLGGQGAECILTYEWGAGSDTLPPPQEKRKQKPRTKEQETAAGGQQGQPEGGTDPGQAVKEAKDEQEIVQGDVDEFILEADKAGQALEYTERWDELMDRLQVIEEQIKILSKNAEVTTNKKTLEILKQEMARNVGLYKETKDELVALSSDELFEDEISPDELKELVEHMHQVKSDIIGFSQNVSKLKNQLSEDDLERYGTPLKDFDGFIKAAMDEIEGRENKFKSLEVGSGTVGISRSKKGDFGKMDREILSEMVKLQKQIDELDRSLGGYPDLSPEEKAVVSRISSLYPKYLDRFIKQHHGSRCKFKILQCAVRRADGCWHFEWEGECPADPNAFNWYPIGSKGKYCSLADLKDMLKKMEDSLR